MCRTFILKNGRHIETLEEFEEHFCIEIDEYIHDSYKKPLSMDSCLCPIDDLRLIQEHPEIGEKFTRNGMNFYEKG